MFHILKILIFCVLINIPAALAQDGRGKITFDFLPEEQTPDYEKIVGQYLEDIKKYNQKYPGTLIEEDFIDDILENHTDYSFKVAGYNEKAIRLGVRSVRLYEAIKEKIQEFLLDTELPIIVTEDQIATSEMQPYQENDKPLILQDFKKVVAYSPEEKDQLAVKNLNNIKMYGQSIPEQKEAMKKAFMEGDWKTFFSYGLFGKALPEKKEGISEWENTKLFRGRLLSHKTKIGEDGKVKGALQLSGVINHILLDEKFMQYKPMSINFEGSENLKQIKINKPLPRRFSIKENTMIGYDSEIFVPFDAEVEDKKQPLVLTANIQGVVCNKNVCETQIISPQLELAAGEGEETSVSSYLNLVDMYAVQEDSEKIKFDGLFVENNATEGIEPILRLHLKAKEAVSEFDAFIQGTEGLDFYSPLISIDNRNIIVRFKAKSAGADIVDKTFNIAVRLNKINSVRKNIKAKNLSLFDTDSGKLSLGMIGLAFLGGLLLNFMPCVFPVLSLKLLTFTKFGKLKFEEIRQSFLLNILGITVSFTILTGALIVLKVLGNSIGWGMQFQNVYFLGFMIFVVTVFLAHVLGIIHFNAPDAVTKIFIKRRFSEKMLHFLTGFFVVLLSTPCTAPYLGTAVGFALSGTLTDLSIIMAAVCCGLSVPYAVFAAFPKVAYYIPQPGRWMIRVSRFMTLMLILTLVWLFNILYAQTSGVLVAKFVGIVFLFLLLLWLRKVLLNIATQQDETEEEIRHMHRSLNIFFGVLFAGVIWWGLSMASQDYARHRKIREEFYKYDAGIIDDVTSLLETGSAVLVRIGADWCLTCKYNDVFVFNGQAMENFLSNSGVHVIDIDWTNYDEEVLKFMEKYGRRGLPFYILFTKRIPEGIVLPEVIDSMDFTSLIKNVNY